MYSQEISRETPACFMFLLDQSFSMEEPFGGNSQVRKCDELAKAINGWLQNMVIKATGGGGIKNWMDVGVFGYRTDLEGQTIIQPCLPGPLAEQPLVPIGDIAENPLGMEEVTQEMFDEETGEATPFTTEMPIWVKAVAEGGTPMCETLEYAYTVLEWWTGEHQNCYPPILINITDGESTDGDPIPVAQKIQGLSTADGNALILNCHLSMNAADPIFFPSSAEVMPEDLAKVLFNMSSVLPEPMAQMAKQEGFDLQSDPRAMVYNANMISLLQFLDMGTRVSKLR